MRQEEDINDEFPDALLLAVQHFSAPWFADIANYLACGILPQELSYQQRKRFLYEVKHYLWEDPFLYKICGDRLIRKCVPKIKMLKILSHCHDSAYDGHFGATKIAAKVLESGFSGLLYSRILKSMWSTVIGVKDMRTSPKGIKCHSHQFKKWRFFTFGG